MGYMIVRPPVPIGPPVQYYLTTISGLAAGGVQVVSPQDGSNLTVGNRMNRLPVVGAAAVVLGYGATTDALVGMLVTLPTPHTLSVIVVDPTATFAYIPDTSTNAIYKISLASFSVVATLAITPGVLVIDPTGTYLYNITTTSTTQIPTSTFTIGTVTAGGYTLSSTAAPVFDPTGAYMYALTAAGSLLRIATSTMTTITSVTSPGTQALAIDPAGFYLYILGSGTTVYRYIAASCTSSATCTTGFNAGALAMDPSGNYLWASASTTLYKISTALFTVSGSVVTGTNTGFVAISVDPTGTYVTTYFSTTIVVCSASPLAVLGTITETAGAAGSRGIGSDPNSLYFVDHLLGTIDRYDFATQSPTGQLVV